MSWALRDSVRGSVLAARLGCSDQTVLNYVKAGMPVAGKDVGGRLFDETECRAWIAKNKPGFDGATGRGGKRAGAGRKSEAGRDDESRVVEVDAKSCVALFGDEAKRRAILADLRAGMDVLELVAVHAVGPTLARSICEMYAAQKAFLDVEERMKKLIPVEEVEAATRDVLSKVDGVLGGIGATVAGGLAAEMGLEARGQDLVRTRVEAAVERAREMLRA